MSKPRTAKYPSQRHERRMDRTLDKDSKDLIAAMTQPASREPRSEHAPYRDMTPEEWDRAAAANRLPTLDDLRRMSPVEANAFLASLGVDWRVTQPASREPRSGEPRRETEYLMWDGSRLIVNVSDQDPGDIGEPRSVSMDNVAYLSVRAVLAAAPSHGPDLREALQDWVDFVDGGRRQNGTTPTRATRHGSGSCSGSLRTSTSCPHGR